MKIKVDNFEGPLDLLLQLIEQEELDITQVSLLQVTEQYLEYLEKIENKQPEMLADFLLIASKLLYIKSKVLLPELDLAADEDSVDLEKQLRLYKKYYEASQVVENILSEDKYAFARPVSLKNIYKFVPAKALNKEKLRKILGEIIASLEPIRQLPSRTIEKIISIKQKIQNIQKLLKEKKEFSFQDIIGEQDSQRDVVVSFLGILELSKQRELVIEQEKPFGEIRLKRFSN